MSSLLSLKESWGEGGRRGGGRVVAETVGCCEDCRGVGIARR